MARYTELQITPTFWAGGTVDQTGDWADGPGCTNGNVGRIPTIGLTSASVGHLQIYAIPATAVSLRYRLFGRTGSGTAHILIQARRPPPDQTILDTLFDDVINFLPGTGVGPCLAMDVPVVALPCQYGTRTKAPFPVAQYVDRDMLVTIFTAVAAPEIAAWLVGFYGTVFLIQELCSAPPPVAPAIDLSTPLASAATLHQLLSAAAWPYFCECTPGTPAPIPYPPPDIRTPPGTPIPPLVTCDGADVCATLVDILTRVGQLQSVVSALFEATTLSQRYGVPFAYIPGRRISNLTGSNSASIDRVVGLRIEVLEAPETKLVLGVPPYVFDLGWISCLTPDGMLDEIRLTRVATTWMSKLLPAATQVGWGLRDGVSIAITELLAEP